IAGLSPDPRKPVKSVVLGLSGGGPADYDDIVHSIGDRVLQLPSNMESTAPVYIVQNHGWIPVREPKIKPGTLFGIQDGKLHAGSLFVLGRDMVWREFKKGTLKVGGKEGFALVET